MINKSNYSIAAPFGWLATSGAVLFGLGQVNLMLTSSIVCATVLSVTTVLLASKTNQEKESKIVPFLGAALFALFAWIAISLVPGTPADVSGGMGLMARSIVVLSAAVILMPILAVVEMLFSFVAVQALARFRGESVLGGELQVVSMISHKFGGVLGSVNR